MNAFIHLFALGVSITGCNAQSTMDVWLTTGDESKKLSQEAPITAAEQNPSYPTVHVMPQTQDQSILGFGAALSNAASYLIYHSPEKETILNDLFSVVNGTHGIGIDFIRLVMGGSDLNAVYPYSYDDMPAGYQDWNLDHFSISKDYEFVIPLIQEILQVNPSLKIVAAPWSAPGWMKDTDSLYGGNFKEGAEYLDVLARYFLQFVQAYAAQGIDLHAVSLQNEPQHQQDGYPTMMMSSTQQKELIRDHVGPLFAQHGISTNIWTWDHNWDGTWYPDDVLGDPDAAQYISGSAWHCYNGDKNDPLYIREKYPDKALYFTECTGGQWDTDFASVLIKSIQNLFIGQTRIGAEAVLLWNMALDEYWGPRVGAQGCGDCHGVIEIPTSGGYTRNVEYYAVGHFGKFVRQGAIRIDSSMPGSGIESAAFLNPDGSIATVVINDSWNSTASFQVELDSEYYIYENLPERSVVTFYKRTEGKIDARHP